MSKGELSRAELVIGAKCRGPSGRRSNFPGAICTERVVRGRFVQGRNADGGGAGVESRPPEASDILETQFK